MILSMSPPKIRAKLALLQLRFIGMDKVQEFNQQRGVCNSHGKRLALRDAMKHLLLIAYSRNDTHPPKCIIRAGMVNGNIPW